MEDQGNRIAGAGAQIPERLRAVGPGWHPLLERLHAQLNVAVPGYRVTDVSEKLGGLRIHVTAGAQSVPDAAMALVAASVTEAAATCEFCGAVGQRARKDLPGGWIKTVCEPCHADWSVHKILIVSGAVRRRSL
ncbi:MULTISPECIES: hypothetical protein [Streptomyces]|uniref:TraR/DksA family transcriptional regulator n=1 Tax=Streptomyces sviceus (strain ATCC 29083 / DSM 924 / JCM 4929 / NBRC 13980 / NCIMB 11184 / NRRL 5439 / UC 5370) TaxID=463191 RepID=B5HSB6_STRX2|nr:MULTISPECIES: hypothetical protein [Streptomyces]EDY55721.1 conserved hypothetical protein [Streptomyces sviceus ATCC 29083]MYT10796.1 TraR/DksA family transcriptional regulator [Streptomyces sp. SID5470]